MDCTECGRELKKDELIYQLRIGYLDEADDFIADSDVAYYCKECTPKETE